MTFTAAICSGDFSLIDSPTWLCRQMMFLWVYRNATEPTNTLCPSIVRTASRKCKTHQEKLICLVCMLSKFCKSVSDKMPSFLVILQGAPRNTLIFCGIQMHSLMSRLRVHFHLFLEQGRERRDPLESSLGWQMGPTATHGS